MSSNQASVGKVHDPRLDRLPEDVKYRLRPTSLEEDLCDRNLLRPGVNADPRSEADLLQFVDLLN